MSGNEEVEGSDFPALAVLLRNISVAPLICARYVCGGPMHVDAAIGRALGFFILRVCWLYRDVSISFVLKYIFKVAFMVFFPFWGRCQASDCLR